MSYKKTFLYILLFSIAVQPIIYECCEALIYRERQNLNRLNDRHIELILKNEKTREQISEKESIDKLREYAEHHGMILKLRQDNP
jgi:cell division protein FtsL